MNEIFVWNGKQSAKDVMHVHVVVRDMRKAEQHHRYVKGDMAKENAKSVARMFMYGLPGNTVDIILGAIEREIQKILALPSGAEILKERFDVENRVRAALEELAR